MGRAEAPVRPSAALGGGLPAPGEDCSAGSVWQVVSSRTGEALVTARERLSVCPGLAGLPPFSAMIVERPLGGAEPGIDISLCATQADGALRAWPRHAGWPAIRNFHRAWVDRGSVLHRSIPSVWLEFDGPQLASAQPAPCFFANMRRLTPPGRQDVVSSVLKLFVSAGQQAAAADKIETLLHLLPPHAHLDFLGFMLARAPASTRICLSIPSQQLVDFLRGAGYPVGAGLHAMARLAIQHNEMVVLHLDIDAGRDSAIGLELKPMRDDGWPALLATLGHEGLCNAQERAALQDFPGKAGIARRGFILSSRDEFSSRAPQRWMDADAFAFARRLNHVKLVCAPGKAPVAKAYLRIDYKWKCREGGVSRISRSLDSKVL